MLTPWLFAPHTPSKGQYSGPALNHILNVGQVRPHCLPRVPLRVVELCGNLATELMAILKAGYAIRSYVWVDTDPNAHSGVSHRIAHMCLQFPHLLPPEALMDWNSRLPMNVRTISPELLRATFPEGIDLLLASSPMLARHVHKTHRERTPVGPDVARHILHLILYLSETQPERNGYLLTHLRDIPHPQTP